MKRNKNWYKTEAALRNALDRYIILQRQGEIRSISQKMVVHAAGLQNVRTLTAFHPEVEEDRKKANLGLKISRENYQQSKATLEFEKLKKDLENQKNIQAGLKVEIGKLESKIKDRDITIASLHRKMKRLEEEKTIAAEQISFEQDEADRRVAEVRQEMRSLKDLLKKHGIQVPKGIVVPISKKKPK